MSSTAPGALTPDPMAPTDLATDEAADAPIKTPRLWQDNGWTAKVVKNENDDGWAVEMYTRGQAEPALIGPWTMGRDKKNPKPLDTAAFNTLVKTASEVIRRHEQALHAQHHKSLDVDATIDGEPQRLRVTLDIVADEDDPHALLSALTPTGDRLAQVRVRADWRFSQANALAWIDAGFSRPR
jgi:hypothetical protein